MTKNYIFQPMASASDETGLRFIGDFDALYASEPDPWGQSGEGEEMFSYYIVSRARLSDGISRLLPMGDKIRGLEIGAGHGHCLKWLNAAMPNLDWVGLDISSIAVNRARVIHPDLKFFVGDIRKEWDNYGTKRLGGEFDVVILSQCLWYVLAEIKDAVRNMTQLCRRGGLIVVSQGFLRGEQKYGREIADGFGGTVGMFLTGFSHLQLIEARFEDRGDYPLHDGLIILRRK
jgi:SAM-dependent methyltransferase